VGDGDTWGTHCRCRVDVADHVVADNRVECLAFNELAHDNAATGSVMAADALNDEGPRGVVQVDAFSRNVEQLQVTDRNRADAWTGNARASSAGNSAIEDSDLIAAIDPDRDRDLRRDGKAVQIQADVLALNCEVAGDVIGQEIGARLIDEQRFWHGNARLDLVECFHCRARWCRRLERALRVRCGMNRQNQNEDKKS